MECPIKIINLKQVLPPGIYPKREYNVRYFYHRTDGCYYMYDEKGCEFNLTTDGNIIPIDKELIVGSESISDDTLICIGLKANYTYPSIDFKNAQCCCHDTYIRAWTYFGDLVKAIETGGIKRDIYKVSIIPAPAEGGVTSCSGSDVIPNDIEYEYLFKAGSEVNLRATANVGYHFVGWKEKGVNEYISISSNWNFKINRDMLLTAIFEKDKEEPKEYYINCNANPANAGYVVGTGVYKENTRLSITAAAIKGYHFKHWSDSSGRIVSTNLQYDIIVSKDETYTALFEEDDEPPIDPTYNVVLTMDPSDSCVLEGGGSYYANSEVTISANPKQGYRFIKWVNADDDSQVSIDSTYKFTIIKNVNYKAVLELIPVTQYTVNVEADPSEGGTVSGSGTFDENSEVTVVATANENYDFVKWVDSSNPDTTLSSQSSYSFTVIKDITLKAIFRHKQVSIQVSCDNKGLVGFDGEANSTSETKTVNKGDQVTIFAKPNEGYSFNRWTKNGLEVSREVSYTLDAETNSMYIAEFIQNDVNHNVTIQTETNDTTKGAVSFDGSDITKITDIQSVAEGSNVTIYAKPAEGYIFDGWYKNDSKISSLETYEVQNVIEEATYIAKFIDEPAEDYLNVDPTEIVFEAEGGTKQINISSNVGWTIS